MYVLYNSKINKYLSRSGYFHDTIYQDDVMRSTSAAKSVRTRLINYYEKYPEPNQIFIEKLKSIQDTKIVEVEIRIKENNT